MTEILTKEMLIQDNGVIPTKYQYKPHMDKAVAETQKIILDAIGNGITDGYLVKGENGEFSPKVLKQLTSDLLKADVYAGIEVSDRVMDDEGFLSTLGDMANDIIERMDKPSSRAINRLSFDHDNTNIKKKSKTHQAMANLGWF